MCSYLLPEHQYGFGIQRYRDSFSSLCLVGVQPCARNIRGSRGQGLHRASKGVCTSGHRQPDEDDPVSFDCRILPSNFEYFRSYPIDHELDLSVFDAHYQNNDNGRPTYDPRQLLKIIILAYSRFQGV